jgi:hypothetical protein
MATELVNPNVSKSATDEPRISRRHRPQSCTIEAALNVLRLPSSAAPARVFDFYLAERAPQKMAPYRTEIFKIPFGEIFIDQVLAFNDQAPARIVGNLPRFSRL